jgi:ubiquinol-cytochrome c reductase subunit 9
VRRPAGLPRAVHVDRAGCIGVYITSIVGASFAFGVAFDVGVTSFWDRWNKGVRTRFACHLASRLLTLPLQKQWKDIRYKYIEE